jgi:hypothetical protein
MIGLRASLRTEKGPNFDRAKIRTQEFLIFLLWHCFSQILPLDIQQGLLATPFICNADDGLRQPEVMLVTPDSTA